MAGISFKDYFMPDNFMPDNSKVDSHYVVDNYNCLTIYLCNLHNHSHNQMFICVFDVVIE